MKEWRFNLILAVLLASAGAHCSDTYTRIQEHREVMHAVSRCSGAQQ